MIIVAGGSGSRMRVNTPKQFLPIGGAKPIIIWTIEAFLHAVPDIQVTVVLPEPHLDRWKKLHRQWLANSPIQVTLGGASRFQSVKSGLSNITSDLIAIHDAVRPFTSPNTIQKAFSQAEATGSGVVMVPLKDSIRKRTANGTEMKDRSQYLAVQTPQVFHADPLLAAFQLPERTTYTDDASVFEAAGHTIQYVEGDYFNIKITTPEDLVFAEAIAQHRMTLQKN